MRQRAAGGDSPWPPVHPSRGAVESPAIVDSSPEIAVGSRRASARVHAVSPVTRRKFSVSTRKNSLRSARFALLRG